MLIPVEESFWPLFVKLLHLQQKHKTAHVKKSSAFTTSNSTRPNNRQHLYAPDQHILQQHTPTTHTASAYTAPAPQATALATLPPRNSQQLMFGIRTMFFCGSRSINFYADPDSRGVNIKEEKFHNKFSTKSVKMSIKSLQIYKQNINLGITKGSFL